MLMGRKKTLAIAMGFLFFMFIGLLRSENTAKANIIGFVYHQDGTTPLDGAVVKVKNTFTGSVYQSSKSDENGVFTIENLESGVYMYGVITAQGEFNSENYFGIRISEGETAKISISVTPYEQKVQSAIQQVYKEQSVSGESLVGTVIDYRDNSKEAEVLVVKGLLQVKDRIHAKGRATDFYQSVEELKLGHSPVKKLFSGQKANLKVNKSVSNGDLIYVVCKRDFLPLFLEPLGIASIIAGSAGIITGISKAANKEANIEQVTKFKK